MRHLLMLCVLPLVLFVTVVRGDEEEKAVDEPISLDLAEEELQQDNMPRSRRQTYWDYNPLLGQRGGWGGDSWGITDWDSNWGDNTGGTWGDNTGGTWGGNMGGNWGGNTGSTWGDNTRVNWGDNTGSTWEGNMGGNWGGNTGGTWGDNTGSTWGGNMGGNWGGNTGSTWGGNTGSNWGGNTGSTWGDNWGELGNDWTSFLPNDPCKPPKWCYPCKYVNSKSPTTCQNFCMDRSYCFCRK